MTQSLNLNDIQGNITRAYGRFAYPFARYFFLNIADADSGRRFVEEVRHKVTTAARWPDGVGPPVTLNIGFTSLGLYALEMPTRTMQGLPAEFIDGMKARAFVLGDRDVNRTEQEAGAWCAHWDPIWQNNRENKGQDVHVWLSMNARLAELGTDTPVPELEKQTDWLRRLCARLDHKVQILATNGQNGDEEYQAASAVFTTLGDKKFPTPREHFGFTDGISDPVFEGQYPEKQEQTAVLGRGKWMTPKKGWEPLATGEFVLGYPDESQELPPQSTPPEFMENGSFMVYRKLHENVGSLKAVVADNAKRYAAERQIPEAEAVETIQAKMIGRWSDGVPLAKVATFAAWQSFRKEKGFDDPDPFKAMQAHRAYLKSPEASEFRYGDDMRGYKCPGGAHVRRVNTRDYLDPLNALDKHNPKATTQLNKRRRILRRGLPYGPDDQTHKDDDTEQGVAMMMIGSSIFRQFEFVQQQWIQYGLDFHQGNNTCPLLGDHKTHKRFTIPSDPETGQPPYVMGDLKTFVETRGGDYFFLPSMTALYMIALGVVDPT